MREYFRTIQAPSEYGMTRFEIGLRREHEKDMQRMSELIDKPWNEFFLK
jgi:hypothetical protein